GHEPGDFSIELIAGGATWRVSLNRTQLHRTGAGAPPTAHLLRRRRMLNLVEAAPGERYEALREFVDVGGIEAAEASLGKAHREAKKGCQRTQEELSTAYRALQRLWEE